MNALFHLPGESNGCNTELPNVRGEGGDTRTTEFAATVQHPFPFHGLDLCNFVRPYENRSQRFLSKFLPISLDCQVSGPIVADIVQNGPREGVPPEQEK
jgi:hypothetical protein